MGRWLAGEGVVGLRATCGAGVVESRRWKLLVQVDGGDEGNGQKMRISGWEVAREEGMVHWKGGCS